jgi:hypothetical protein
MSSATVECDHSDDAATCPVCLRARRPLRQARWSRAFPASYDTAQCDGCPNEIRQGELIRIREHAAEDRTEKRHAECV